MQLERKVAAFEGSGFIGSYILEDLFQNGFQPTTLVRNKSKLELSQVDSIKAVDVSIVNEEGINY